MNDKLGQWSINRWCESLGECSDTVLIVIWAVAKAVLKGRGARLLNGRWILRSNDTPQALDAVDPHAQLPGKPSTREKGSSDV